MSQKPSSSVAANSASDYISFPAEDPNFFSNIDRGYKLYPNNYVTFSKPSGIMQGPSLYYAQIDTTKKFRVTSFQSDGKSSFKIYCFYDSGHKILQVGQDYLSGEFFLTSPNSFIMHRSDKGTGKFTLTSVKVVPKLYNDKMNYELHFIVKPSVRSQTFFALFPDPSIYYDFPKPLGADTQLKVSVHAPLSLPQSVPQKDLMSYIANSYLRIEIPRLAGSYPVSIVPSFARQSTRFLQCPPSRLELLEDGEVIANAETPIGVKVARFSTPQAIRVNHISFIVSGVVIADRDTLELVGEARVFSEHITSNYELELEDIPPYSDDSEGSIGLAGSPLIPALPGSTPALKARDILEVNRPLLFQYINSDDNPILRDYNNRLQGLNSRFRDDRCAVITIYPFMLLHAGLPLSLTKNINSLQDLHNHVQVLIDSMNCCQSTIRRWNMIPNVKPDALEFVTVLKRLVPQSGIYLCYLDQRNRITIRITHKGFPTVIIFNKHVELAFDDTPISEPMPFLQADKIDCVIRRTFSW